MINWFAALLCLALLNAPLLAQGRRSAASEGPAAAFSQILGRPGERGVTISLLSAVAGEAYVEYGTVPGAYAKRTAAQRLPAGVPTEFQIDDLAPDTAYVYRVRTRSAGAAGASDFASREAGTFRTQRKRGATFTFGVQGDSHPERAGRMFDADLYTQAMRNVAKDAPDFYFMMGDDFSIERLIEQGNKSQDAVNAIYAHQRGFLGLVGKSTPVMLVNGNHEQAAKYLLDGTASNFAVLAGKARTTYFPLPAPGGIYSGNGKPVEHIGLLRDYYAWEWGDALFVVIDPYWHSDVAVDNEAGVRAPQRDGGGGGAGGVGVGVSQPSPVRATVTRSAGRARISRAASLRGMRLRAIGRARATAISGRSRWVTTSTRGSARRSRRAPRSLSSSSRTTSRARGAAAWRSRGSMSGAGAIAAA